MVKRGILLATLAALGAELHAQEFSFLAGAMQAPAIEDRSYSWQIDFRHRFSRHASWSLAWINEGHVDGHRRDGLAGEIWAELPLYRDRFTFSLGGGPYRSFDTHEQADGDATIVHAWSGLLSLSLTYQTESPWFVRFMANRIAAHHDVAVFTEGIGAGYFFGAPAAHVSAAAATKASPAAGNEFTFYVGTSVVNNPMTGHTVAYSAEYRRGIGRHLDWTLQWIDEGDPDVAERYGLATELWLTGKYFDERLELGLGFGLYGYLDPLRSPDSGSQVRLATLISPEVAWRFSDSWNARLIWHRVSSDYSRDADIFFLGLGYRWH